MKKIFIILLIAHCSLQIVQAQWVQQPLPINKPITGIKFINSQTGWACTSRGTPADTGYIIATTNSGTNWFVQISAFNNAFTDINALDNLTCFASAYDAVINRDKIYKTSDGGQNWTVITMVPNMGIDDMQFLNKDSAWECGTSVGPDVRTTTDGGNTWIVRTSGITMATERVFFLNYNTGFCAANFNLYRTTNAGLNWELNGNFIQAVKSLYFVNINTGWLGFANNNRIRYTSNGGINWIDQVPPSVPTTAVFDLYFFNSLTGYAGNGIDRIFKTTNGGINWGYQTDTGGSLIITFTDTLNGWTATNYGINRTTNGGGNITYTGFTNNGTEIPLKYRLYQNYPNPFNPATTIKLDLPEAANINLVICDLLGREIYQITNENLKAGSYSFTWDATSYSTGIYFYRLQTDKYSETRKLMLLK